MLVNKQIAKDRFQICKSCEHFNSLLKMCKKCGCIMPLKVTMSISRCPVGKWGQAKIDPTETTDYRIEE
jgi:Family of unknown function (DUF6171)